MTTEEQYVTDPAEQADLARRLTVALATGDLEALRAMCEPDVAWTVPGTGVLAGRHEGVEGLVEVERTIVGHALGSQVEHLLFGPDSIVAVLHVRGDGNGRHVDARVGLHVQLRDGRVAAVTSHLGDPAAYSAYFAPLPG
jgi:uncharacterized protein